ncbi:MAG: IS66 family transposase [Deltaproteobacteria bacterium]|nr:MAG: IS66 family transposase [Deltaproteobacteria bacterium]
MMNEACIETEIDKLNKMICSFSIREKVYVADIASLKEQIRSLQVKLFGRSSEANITPDDKQINLFDLSEDELPTDIAEDDEIEVPGHIRKKPGRKPIPKDLPRIDVEHDLTDEEKQCQCGCIKTRIGTEVSEQLDIIPARIQVIRNIRHKYACKNCEGVEDDGPTVSIARMPDQIIPKSIATPGLIAHVLTAKFVDALPFYRQEKQFIRMGIEISRATMCNWSMKVAGACDIILDMLKDEILKNPVINIDETTIQVLKEPKRSKSYMWLFKGGPPEKPVILYQYHPSRSGDVAVSFLNRYQGIVQTDGYSGYGFLDASLDIVHMGCWAHCRRKFTDVIKAGGNKKKSSGNAGTALKYISKLYKIEKQARENELTPEALKQERQDKSLPILLEFKKWLGSRIEKVPPKSLLGKAVSYALNQWHRLIQYVEDGRIPIDNNVAENAIRPFVVGRKNWLFSCTPKGARASAALYSLIETAKANKLEPYWYLRYLFKNLPEAMTSEEFKQLLPMYVDKAALNIPEYK